MPRKQRQRKKNNFYSAGFEQTPRAAPIAWLGKEHETLITTPFATPSLLQPRRLVPPVEWIRDLPSQSFLSLSLQALDYSCSTSTTSFKAVPDPIFFYFFKPLSAIFFFIGNIFVFLDCFPIYHLVDW